MPQPACGSAPGLNRNRYDKGLAVSTEEMAALHVRSARTPGPWNYVITPRART